MEILENLEEMKYRWTDIFHIFETFIYLQLSSKFLDINHVRIFCFVFFFNFQYLFISILFQFFFFIMFDILGEIEWRVTRSAELRLRTAR